MRLGIFQAHLPSLFQRMFLKSNFMKRKELLQQSRKGKIRLGKVPQSGMRASSA